MTGYKILLSSIQDGRPPIKTMIIVVHAKIPAYSRCIPGKRASKKNRQETGIRNSNILILSE
jgi:hypothetical protein